MTIFGFSQITQRWYGDNFFVELISYDKKKAEHVLSLVVLKKILFEYVFRLGKLEEAAQKTRPIVIELTNP